MCIYVELNIGLWVQTKYKIISLPLLLGIVGSISPTEVRLSQENPQRLK